MDAMEMTFTLVPIVPFSAFYEQIGARALIRQIRKDHPNSDELVLANHFNEVVWGGNANQHTLITVDYAFGEITAALHEALDDMADSWTDEAIAHELDTMRKRWQLLQPENRDHRYAHPLIDLEQ